MEGFLDTATQLCIDWGYWGLFLSALIAGSVLPFSSEAVIWPSGSARPAWIFSARSSFFGSALPRSNARRSIPKQALGVK